MTSAYTYIVVQTNIEEKVEQTKILDFYDTLESARHAVTEKLKEIQKKGSFVFDSKSNCLRQNNCLFSFAVEKIDIEKLADSLFYD